MPVEMPSPFLPYIWVVGEVWGGRGRVSLPPPPPALLPGREVRAWQCLSLNVLEGRDRRERERAMCAYAWMRRSI